MRNDVSFRHLTDGSKSDDCCLLGCDDVQFGIIVASFQKM